MDKFSITTMLQKIWQVLCAISNNMSVSKQASWDESDETSPSYIKDKPAIENVSGANSLQQKGRSVLSLGEGAVATGEGEEVEVTVTSASLVGDDTTTMYYQPLPEGQVIRLGDVIKYKDQYSIVSNIFLGTEHYGTRINVTPARWGSLRNGSKIYVVRGIALGQNSSVQNAKNSASGPNSNAKGFIWSL